MSSKCTGNKPWQCTDGTCVDNYFSCVSPSSKCRGKLNSYYCGHLNGDNCVYNDVNCMRECGMNSDEMHKFDRPCPGFPGKCTWISFYCPFSCGDKVNCPHSNRCEKTLAFCDSCFNFRCANTGICIASYKECNGFNDCGDYSDERNCGSSGSGSSGSGSSGSGSSGSGSSGSGSSGRGTIDVSGPAADTMPIAVGVSVSVGVFILILVCILCMVRKRNTNRGGRGILSPRQRGGGPTGGPTIVGATPIARPPQIASATSPHGSNSQLLPPGQLPFAVVPSAPGSSHSLNSASSHPAAPPPSYDEVVDNDRQFRIADTQLPSYADSEHIPPVNPNYTSTSSV
ncbi:low-density lipoprotein receptor-related protein-like isoform X2 [Lineus longissimus]|uniref:low-density lipoprotein receptor-related protein-like isoform X2 n=1 Tax=Lineus longissimus TaxID=88925 RepID=UPI00315D88C7